MGNNCWLKIKMFAVINVISICPLYYQLSLWLCCKGLIRADLWQNAESRLVYNVHVLICLITRLFPTGFRSLLSKNEKMNEQLVATNNVLKLPAFYARRYHWWRGKLPRWYCSDHTITPPFSPNVEWQPTFRGFLLVEVFSSTFVKRY